MFNVDRGSRVNVVRAVNAYGPRQLAAAPFGPGKVRKTTPALVCRALSGMPVEL
jgi:UDP-glucose 4-epimerase